MALKLSVSSRPSVVAHCSTEELLESIENVSSAAEALYEAGADGQEICQVLDNLTLIASALDNGGLTPEFLKTFNAEGETLEAAGVESLSVAGLEAMGNAQIEKFEDRVAAGLEGKMGEYWAKFVAWLKNMWTKFVNWFKSILVNRAKYIKSINALLADKNAKWQDKEGSVIKMDVVQSSFKAASDAETYLSQNVGKLTSDAAPEELKVDDFIKELDKIGEAKAEAKKLSELGWTEPAAKQFASTYVKNAANASLNKINTLIDASFKGLITKAGAAGKLEDAEAAKTAKETVQKRRENLMKCVDLLRNDNRCVMKCGATVYKVLKIGFAAK